LLQNETNTDEYFINRVFITVMIKTCRFGQVTAPNCQCSVLFDGQYMICILHV